MGDATIESKEELERRQLLLANKKLEAETAKLDRESRPEKWWSALTRNIIFVGGIGTVLATLFGIYDSYTKTIDDRAKTLVADQRARLEDAIKRIESKSPISKLVGVSVLSNYLIDKDSHVHRQILFTLAGLMATENDYQAQAAVIDLISAIPVDGPISGSEWTYFQDMLISQSRALVAKRNLADAKERGTPPYRLMTTPKLSDEEQSARTVGRLIALNVRRGIMPAANNFRNVYCVGCDFSDVIFPKAADFTGAILDAATFRGATLEGAIFDNAGLLGTEFINADLQHATFRSLAAPSLVSDDLHNDKARVDDRTHYLEHAAELLADHALVWISMPDFSCANLEDANFEGHALFPGLITARRVYADGGPDKDSWQRDVPKYYRDKAKGAPDKKVEIPALLINPPNFFRANLSGTKLSGARVFAATMWSNIREVTFGQTKMGSASYHDVAELTFWQGAPSWEIFNKTPTPKDEPTQPHANSEDARFARAHSAFFTRLGWSFRETLFEQAILGDGLLGFLKNPPDDRDAEVAGEFAFHRDPVCKTRMPTTAPPKASPSAQK